MAELKDNSFDVMGVLTDVHPTKNDVTKVTFEIPTDALETTMITLTKSYERDVKLKITPAQTELDTEGDEEDGQTELDGMGE
ncbi:hypothetical protein ACRYI5_03345 [Furfurilactobacillus sp. WILCCON 0119]